MNILQSIAGNKTILKVALSQIGNAMERDGVAAFVIIRDPNNTSEESNGLDIRTFKEAIAILSGSDLTEYQNYLAERDRVYDKVTDHINEVSDNDTKIADETEPPI
jgi:hypothetical protein